MSGPVLFSKLAKYVSVMSRSTPVGVVSWLIVVQVCQGSFSENDGGSAARPPARSPACPCNSASYLSGQQKFTKIGYKNKAQLCSPCDDLCIYIAHVSVSPNIYMFAVLDTNCMPAFVAFQYHVYLARVTVVLPSKLALDKMTNAAWGKA